MTLELASNTFDGAELRAAMQVLESGMFTMGAKTMEFERRFAERIGHGLQGVMVNSGSSANLLLIAGLVQIGDLKPGRTVFAPALTWPTTITPLLQYGMKVVLVDCDPVTLQMDANQLRRAVVEHGDGQAVFCAHIMGNACDMDPIQHICDQRGLLLIEDCCEALGTEYKGKTVGNHGSGATFSFFFSHHISTMEGGMVVTGNSALAEAMRSLRAHGWIRDASAETKAVLAQRYPELDQRFLFTGLGYNLRPTDIQAAIGLEQLKKLGGFLESRAAVERSMRQIVNEHLWLCAISPTAGSKPAWFAFPVLLDGERRALSSSLEESGIQTRPIVGGNLAEHPAFQGKVVSYNGTPQASYVQRHGLYWGLHPNVTHLQLRDLEAALNKYAAERRAT